MNGFGFSGAFPPEIFLNKIIEFLVFASNVNPFALDGSPCF